MSLALCIAEGARTVVIAATAFTLSWTHTVELVAWEEDWLVTADGLEIVEARVKGSGAGMEPPEGAVLRDGWWHYAPGLPPQPRIALAPSGTARSTWWLCAGGACRDIGVGGSDAVELAACEATREDLEK